MGLFGGKKSNEDENTETPDGADTPAFEVNPRKANSFFKHAQAVGDARNYDYSIVCFTNGLKFDPENIEMHEKLYDVATRRKVSGGKPASLLENVKYSGGKNPVEKAINAEFLWAKDPLNPNLALSAMEAGVKAGINEYVYWVGKYVIENNKNSKKPSKAMFLKTRDLFSKIEAYTPAVEACQLALMFDTSDMKLRNDLKDLDAMKTMEKGRYEEKGDFRDSIDNKEAQEAIQQDESMAKTGDALHESIKRLRGEWEDNVDDLDKFMKLIRIMMEAGEDDIENEAIKILKERYESTNQYRFKVLIGDIKIKRYNRYARKLKAAFRDATDDAKKKAYKDKLNKILSDQLKFELAEFTERVNNYPSDMGLKFQLGRRQFTCRDYDKAIASFQEAQSDPKNRTWSLRFLGEAFAKKEWYDEAIDTFRRGIDSYKIDDDKLGLELRYQLMLVLEGRARRDEDLKNAEEASKVASSIAQSDINYRDISDRNTSLRELIKTLKAAG